MLKMDCVCCNKPIEVSVPHVTTEYNLESDIPELLCIKLETALIVCGGCGAKMTFSYDVENKKLEVNEWM